MGAPSDTCSRCGYDIGGAGGAAVCSECGTPIDRTEPGRADAAWRRRRVWRWVAMTAAGFGGAAAGLVASCFSVGLVSRGDWAFPGALAMGWCGSTLAALWVRHAMTPRPDRARRRRRSVIAAAALGVVCTGAAVVLAIAAVVALVPFPSPD